VPFSLALVHGFALPIGLAYVCKVCLCFDLYPIVVWIYPLVPLFHPPPQPQEQQDKGVGEHTLMPWQEGSIPPTPPISSIQTINYIAFKSNHIQLLTTCNRKPLHNVQKF
jgi:hypothetical protein